MGIALVDGDRHGDRVRLMLLIPLLALGVISIGAPVPPTGPGTASPPGLAGAARRSASLGTGPSAAGTVRRWSWPLAPRPRVVHPFTAPSTAYGPGHRGVDLADPADRGPGQTVLAVDSGTVTHVGRIAGRGTVTVLHPSGVRSTYEPVTASVRRGQVVPRGAALGRLEALGAHCAGCLHLGALRGSWYLDPMLLLVGGRPVRLLPLAQAPDG